MSDQDLPVSDTIRRRVDAYTGPDHYRFTIDGIEYDAHWAHDTRRLLDENARLNAELESLRVHNGVLVTEIYHQAARADAFREERDALVVQHQADLAARRTAEEHLRRDVVEIDEEREALAAKLDAVRAAAREIHEPMRLWPTREDPMGEAQECMACREPFPCDTIRALDAAPEMPRPPAEEACCTCSPTDPSTWETYGGLTEPTSSFEWDPDCPAHGVKALSEAAQERAGDTNTSPAGSGRGTGVAETPGTAQGYEDGRRIAVSMMDRAEAKYRHEHGQPHLREHCETCAEEYWANRLRPAHYREAAASLRKIADADEKADPPIGGEVDYLRGWRHAANRLDSVAKDLDDEAPSLPVPSTEDSR